jgi:transcriptional regulator with XRE-family HTH domain
MNEKEFQFSLVVIGNKLIELRKKKGYNSHEDFALDYELPRVQYWRLEKGKTNFTYKTLYRILTIHKISAPEFFQMLHEKK